MSVGDYKRGRPTNALGGTPRKDHIFRHSRSLCGKWMYGGGQVVDPDDVDPEGSDALCKTCARRCSGGGE